MNKPILLVVAILVCTCVALAQKGTAEADYYPLNYGGDTWTGVVTAINEATREFTLTYRNNGKEQTFVGVLIKGYAEKMRDGTNHEVRMAELLGMQLKAYYIAKTKKVNDKKVKIKEVFRIRFLPRNK